MKLASALAELADALRQSGHDFAVIGGLAASARAEARFTRDIDVAVAVADDTAAEALIVDLTQRGYRVLATVEHDSATRLATARLRAPSDVVCDLVFATSGIEPEVVAAAEPIELLPGVQVRTALPEGLIAMKVLSATPSRPRDAADIGALLRTNSWTAIWSWSCST